jgi:shikimate dehydrogenase
VKDSRLFPGSRSPSASPAFVGLIGHPVGHSVSPVFQQAAFDALGLAFRYEAWDTTADGLTVRLASLRAEPFAGANVTVPYKEAVTRLLDRISDEAAAVGAVNTIVRDGDRLLGYNTDIAGFLDALRFEGGLDVHGVRACVLGAGGAARAAVYALLSGGVARVSVHNRTRERADALVSSLDPGDGRLVAAGGDAGAAVAGCDLIVNCTSMGMAGSALAGASPLPAAQIPPGAFVYDIVANPAITPLLAAARSRGCRTLGGLPMLVRQGAAAFTLWTGRPAPLDVMFHAARKAMSAEC